MVCGRKRKVDEQGGRRKKSHEDMSRFPPDMNSRVRSAEAGRWNGSDSVPT